MGQNQSHVAKYETAQICILSENVKYVHFLFPSKKKYLCNFVSVKLIFSHFC